MFFLLTYLNTDFSKVCARAIGLRDQGFNSMGAHRSKYITFRMAQSASESQE